jgi:hypothetical protein
MSHLGTYRRLYNLQFLDWDSQKVQAGAVES